jgi:hypothetical protein
MKKTGILLAMLLPIQTWMFAQENDTTIVAKENADSTVIIVSDDEEGVSINMDEVVKEDKRDTTKIKLGDKNINIIEDEKGTSV